MRWIVSDPTTAAGSYSVGRVATLSGVTIRTLHHYDEIGLLSPHERSDAGYRVYEEADLVTLQRILFYREFGFTLKEISTIIEDPGTDAIGHLRRQRDLLVERIERWGAMVNAIDHEMEARTMDIKLTPEERFKVSNRRVSKYRKEDWLKLKAEAEEIQNRLAAAFEAGLAADSEEAMAGAEAHRQHISRWFYECGYGMHRGLTEMYVGDERFRSHYDKQAPGLANFIKEAAHANADRAEKGDSQ